MINRQDMNHIVNIMQRKDHCKTKHLLCQQEIFPCLTATLFSFSPIRAFENCVEKKTNNLSVCLNFLEQYTRGQPRELVKSCQHLPKDTKDLLAEHFGNEYKIASAYMDKILNWPLRKPEDAEALQSFSVSSRLL